MSAFKCIKCGREYSTNEIRFSSSNRLECVYCLGIKQSNVKGEQKPDIKPVAEQISYQCTSCNYSFKRKKSASIASCPYCNKENTLTIKKMQDASAILNQSLDRKYEF